MTTNLGCPAAVTLRCGQLQRQTHQLHAETNARARALKSERQRAADEHCTSIPRYDARARQNTAGINALV
ncbi:hypothetical protein [Cognatilysobacter lacus]|uniref:Uncharacterized protein n=1 Tax=Cognatilysobacter lacus TaxID=1643323 RepID=A0A5D8Z832_9GAMM|nr:hypothetical protein [Lysobacter lacus]TZF90790.1 hypothetical protein FW784_03830 [Lysobacter lacus]